MNRHARAFVAAIVMLLALAPAVLAHEVAIEVVCGQGITVNGIFFTGNPADSEPLRSPVTVTGPGGYSESFEVTEATWSHTFPLGPNGAYHIDWPEAGSFAQDFTVDCAVPTPTPTPRPTPTVVCATNCHHFTVPPSDTATEPVQGSGTGMTFALSAVLVLAATVFVLYRRAVR